MGPAAGIAPMSRWILAVTSCLGAAARMNHTNGELNQLTRKDSGNWVNLGAILPGLAQSSRGGQIAGGGLYQ